MTPRIVGAMVALGLVGALSGCFQNPLEAALDRAVEEGVTESLEQAVEAETGAEVDIGTGASLPSGWPANIPVPDGDIISSLATGGEFYISVTSPNAAAAQAGLEALKGAGFEVTLEQNSDGFAMYVLSDGTHDVSYSWMDDGAGAIAVTMTVTAAMAQ